MRTAWLVGGEHPGGAEISAALQAASYELHGPESALDLLVVNCPVLRPGTAFADITDAAFDAVMQDILFAAVQAGQAALPRMAQGGAIVHVAARGHQGAWGGAHLMAANAALIGMTRSMALELAAEGIRVNVVATDFSGERWDTPAARVQVAQTVVFLASEAAGLITGETILLDAARSLRMSESRRP